MYFIMKLLTKYALLRKLSMKRWKIIRFLYVKIVIFLLWKHILKAFHLDVSVCFEIQDLKYSSIMKYWSLNLKLYASKNITGKEIYFILLPILVILKYFKTRHTKINIFRCDEKIYLHIELIWKLQFLKQVLEINFMLKFTLVSLMFLNWAIWK